MCREVVLGRGSCSNVFDKHIAHKAIDAFCADLHYVWATLSPVAKVFPNGFLNAAGVLAGISQEARRVLGGECLAYPK